MSGFLHSLLLTPPSMSRIAFFSDVHANIEALDAVLEDLTGGSGVEQIFCLGDVVGYGPNPNEVIGRLLALEENGFEVRHTIGNHDSAVIGRCEFVDLHDPDTLERVCREGGFEDEKEIVNAYRNPETRTYVPVKVEAEQTVRWTIEHLTEEARSFLEARLEERIEVQPGAIAVHASPRDVSFEYIRDAGAAHKVFESSTMDGVKICFHAHTHIPVAYTLPAEERMSYAGSTIVMGEVETTFAESLNLDLDRTLYLLNVGSVGQPRGDDRRPCYAVYDSEAATFELRRVDYDPAPTIAKIREYGLPEALALRLGGNAEVEVDVEP